MSFNYVYSSGALTLVPTAAKTANYTAAVNDLVIVDGTSGSPVITLPTAPPNLSTVGVKRYDATYTAANIPTIAVGGSDAFLGGSTTALQLLLQGQVVILQYNATTAQWLVRSTDQPLSQLDLRYSLSSAASTRVAYTTTQTGLAVPTGVTGVWIESLIGPGGGGGSGRRGPTSTVNCGGGGGGSAGMIVDLFIPAALLGSTFTVTLPAGGAGGAAVTADSTNGNNGASAGVASFASGSTLVTTWPGAAAVGGTNALGTGGGAGAAPLSGAAGGSASTSGGVGNAGGFTTNGAPSGGGSGGGIATGGTPAANGGNGGLQTLNYFATVTSGGVVGGASPGAGNAAAAGIGGLGAAGGASSITGAAQAGADATGYGAGGGGGGASLNGNNSGKGGNGGGSYCRLNWVYI